MRRLVKKILPKLPKSVQSYVIERGRHLQDRSYVKQPCIPVQIGNFTLEVPRRHLLTDVLKTQPYRDLCVGITAKFVAQKYQDATIVDIGANIGDTAAVIATYTKNPLILVEPSEFFFGILQRNAKLLPNPVTLKRSFVANGKPVKGALHYHAGTAYIDERSSAEQTLTTERLSDIADRDTRFVKIDTDGFDVPILRDSLEWLEQQHPVLLFECSISGEEEFTSTDHLYDDLKKAGYGGFIAWDDAGFCILSTRCVEVMKDLNRYLYNLKRTRFSRAISNMDIACFHSTDADVCSDVMGWFRLN